MALSPIYTRHQKGLFKVTGNGKRGASVGPSDEMAIIMSGKLDERLGKGQKAGQVHVKSEYIHVLHKREKESYRK